ncbi:MAG: hypothetical protein EKK64_06555 [Neisseriaceae bacterium]|nr:MAG: hypothetical protein EKK64_06555 [Neisseriaceae bacterium]
MIRRNFLNSILALPVFSFLGMSKNKEENKIEKEPIEFYNGVNIDYSKNMTDEMKIGLEADIATWLKNYDSPMLEVNIKGISGPIVFFRSEINIKSALNVWEVWYIASSDVYPKLISYKKGYIGTNQYEDGLVLNNEIRPVNYGSGEEKRSFYWFNEKY